MASSAISDATFRTWCSALHGSYLSRLRALLRGPVHRLLAPKTGWPGIRHRSLSGRPSAPAWALVQRIECHANSLGDGQLHSTGGLMPESLILLSHTRIRIPKKKGPVAGALRSNRYTQI